MSKMSGCSFRLQDPPAYIQYSTLSQTFEARTLVHRALQSTLHISRSLNLPAFLFLPFLKSIHATLDCRRPENTLPEDTSYKRFFPRLHNGSQHRAAPPTRRPPEAPTLRPLRSDG